MMRTNFRFEEQNLTMVRGDTLSFNMQCVNNANETIEADNVFFTCKRAPTDETAIFRKTLDDGITFEDGWYTLRVAPEDTRKAEIGQYYYDVEIVVGEDAYTVVRGTITIEQNIS